MKKVIIAVVVLAILGVGGYFGFHVYVQSRARSDLDQMFATLRAQGAQASYKDVAFRLTGRELTVSDIDITAPGGGAHMKVARLVAREVTAPSGGMVQAKSVEVTGLNVDLKDALLAGTTVTYVAPQVVLTNYSGPDRMPVAQPGNKSNPVLRDSLVLFAALRIDAISIPTLSGEIVPAAGQAGAKAQPASFTYEAITASGIGDGRIAELTFGKMRVTSTTQVDDKPTPTVTEVVNVRASGIDTGPIRALTDTEPKAASPLPIYTKVTSGAYSVKQGDASTVTAGAMTADRIAINPQKLSLDRLQQLSELAQQTPSNDPKLAREAIERALPAIDGFAFGQIALTDVSVVEKDGSAKIAAMKLDGFVDGRLETFEILGLEAHNHDQQPVTLKRAAITGLSLKNILQQSAKVASSNESGQLVALDAAAAVLKSFSGFELEGLIAPYDTSGKPVTIEAMALSWGDFTGLLPTRVSFRLDKLTGPISAEDGEPFSYLAAAGLDRSTISSQINMSYAADTGSLSLAPAAMELEKAFSFKVDARVDNVAKDVFDKSPKEVLENPGALFAKLDAATAGPVTVTLTNLGVADLMLKQQAEAAGVEPEDLRAELASGIQEAAKLAVSIAPEAQSVGEALAAFVKTPGTLTVTLTPKQPVPLLHLISLSDPMEALPLFTITATATP